MDVLTIQWGWVGGYKTKIAPSPAPVVTVVEARRWPGPSYTIYREGMIPMWQHRREEDEIIIL